MKNQVKQFLQNAKDAVASFLENNLTVIASIICLVLLFGLFYVLMVIKLKMDPSFFVFGTIAVLIAILRSATNP